MWMCHLGNIYVCECVYIYIYICACVTVVTVQMNEDIQDQKDVFTFQHVTCRKD